MFGLSPVKDPITSHDHRVHKVACRCVFSLSKDKHTVQQAKFYRSLKTWRVLVYLLAIVSTTLPGKHCQQLVITRVARGIIRIHLMSRRLEERGHNLRKLWRPEKDGTQTFK